jgi:hypothetical protein
MRDVFSSLPGALREFAANDKAREAVVIAAWNRAVGPGLGEHTAPVQLDGKVLIVAVSSETWKKQIADLAGQILFKLNGALGTALVSYIQFTVDAKFVRKQNKLPARSKSDAEWDALVAGELTSDLKTAANEIENETLRQLFLSASTSSLARQRSDLKKIG